MKKEIKKIEEKLKNKTISHRLCWEIVKINMREFCIRYSVNEGISQKQQRTALQKELNDIITKLENDPFNENLNSTKLNCDNELNNM